MTVNEAMDKVVREFESQDRWNDINVQFAQDKDKQEYAIFDGWDDHNKYTSLVKQVLELADDTQDYEIEKILDVELVFFDEYKTCSDCGNVIRTSPTHYGWQPDFYIGDGFIACNECFNETKDYQRQYIEEHLNNPKQANQLLSEEQLEGLGFKKLNDENYENGWHDGQNDNPTEIYEKIEHLYYDVLFNIDSVGQFDVQFDVWVRGEI